MEDHLYARVMRPPIIVVKEEPIWKLANKEGTMEDFFCVTDEEPELEWTISKDVELEEDPLLISDTEESSLSIENSISSISSACKSIKSSLPINEEKRHFAGISLINNGNDLEEDNDSLDSEVAALLKQNNKECTGFKKENEDYDVELVKKVDESLNNDGRQFKTILQSFNKKEVSTDVDLINENENIKLNKTVNVESPKSLLINNCLQIENDSVKTKIRSQKYSLRTSRSIVKRYSPVDFTETIERTFKKTKNNRNISSASIKKNIINKVGIKFNKLNNVKQEDTFEISSNNSDVKDEEIKTSNRSQNYSLRKFRPILKRYTPVDFNNTKTNSDESFSKDIMNYLDEVNEKDVIESNNSEVKNEELKAKNRSKNYSLRKSRSIVKRYSPVDFNETKTNSDESFSKDILNYLNQISQKDTIETNNSKVKNKELKTKNRSKNCSLHKSRSIVKRYSPVDFNETKTNNSESFNTDIINYINDIRQKDAINGEFNADKTLHDIEFNCYVNKRNWHNKLEKHRRTLISELFCQLSNEFPSKLRLSNKLSKIHVLNSAVNFIDELNNRDQYLVKTKIALKQKQKCLEDKLEKLKKDLRNRT